MAETDLFLRHVPLFQGISPDELALIERGCTRTSVRPSETVVVADDETDDAYFVIRGFLQVEVSIAERCTILRDLREGDFFGELAAIDGQRRSASIRAVTVSELAIMPSAIFRRAIHTHPEICDRVLGMLAREVRRLANRANEQTGLTMKHRLWAELLRMARPVAGTPGAASISPPPTHVELAARVGSHREAVTRELSRMQRQGLVARRRGALALADVAKLRGMLKAAAEGH